MKTTAASSISQEEDLEAQLVNLEREAVRKANSGGGRLRRVRKSVNKSRPLGWGVAQIFQH